MISQYLQQFNLNEFAEVLYKNGWTVIDIYKDLTLNDLIEMGFKKGHINTWKKLVNSNLI